jgi:hypothetical protein
MVRHIRRSPAIYSTAKVSVDHFDSRNAILALAERPVQHVDQHVGLPRNAMVRRAKEKIVRMKHGHRELPEDRGHQDEGASKVRPMDAR